VVVDESATVYVYIPQRGMGRRCDVNRVISLGSPRRMDQVTYLSFPPKITGTLLTYSSQVPYQSDIVSAVRF
jgi:hypothetical protein